MLEEPSEALQMQIIELNELNFDLIRAYLNQGENLPFFKKLFADGIYITESEKEFECIEPWIQWVSYRTGKNQAAHGVFRLGDKKINENETFYARLEKLGMSVGAVSPMNCPNELKSPAFFIPDPWTPTCPDASFTSQIVYQALKQAINHHATERLSVKTLTQLVFIAVRLNFIIPFAWNSINQIINGRFYKAAALDTYLILLYQKLYMKKKPDFATLFLNAGAHLQHHYLGTSSQIDHQLDHAAKSPSKKFSRDVILDIIKVYDSLLPIVVQDAPTVILTGLSQQPVDKQEYYYRIIDLDEFLKYLSITYISSDYRMSRDFEITFSKPSDLDYCYEVLSGISINQTPLFGVLEKKQLSLFVTLTYSQKINLDTYVDLAVTELSIPTKFFALTAIKNAEHSSKGYFWKSHSLPTPPKSFKIENVFNYVIAHFEQT